MSTIKGKTMKYEKGTLLRGISNEYTGNFILIESIGTYYHGGQERETLIYHFLILNKDMKRDWHWVTYVESDNVFVEVAT
jgi:hypothetical protein